MAKEQYKEINANRKIINEELYEQVSEELNIPIHLVKDVISAHSEFTATTIKVGAFESIIFPYLGKVKAKLRTVQKVMQIKADKVSNNGSNKNTVI